MDRKKAILQCALGCFFWAASGLAGQYLLVNRMIAPEWLTFCRLFAAGVLLLLIARLSGDIFAIWHDGADRMKLLVFGAFGMLGTQYGYFASIKYSNAPTATVLEYLMPILIIFWLCISEKRLPRAVEVLCTAFAFLGTVLIATHGNFTALALSERALFWGLLAAVACALYTVIPHGIIKKYGAPIVIGWGMCIAAVVMAPLMPFAAFTGNIDLAVAGAFAFVVIFGTICSFVLYLGSTKYISPAEASIIAALEPLSSILFAFLLFGQSFGLVELLGMGLIIVAVGVVTRK